MSSDVGTFLQRVADDADDFLRFSINSSYYSLMGDFCQNALSSSASSAKAPQCSRADRLVRHFDGSYKLVGGTPEDRATAGGQVFGYVFVILHCLWFLNGEKLMPLSGRGVVDCIHGGGNFLHITVMPRAYTYKPVAVGG